MSKGFFRCTCTALDEISNLYNVIWGIDVALHNLRRNFYDDYRANGTIVANKLDIKYCTDCRVSTLDYDKTFLKKTWEDQEEEIAWLLLNSIIPIFEGWWEEIRKSRFSSFSQKEIPKPDTFQAKNKTLTKLSAHPSQTAKQIFGDVYKNSDKYISQNLDLHYICFRLFKCMRNAYMHNGRIAHSSLIKAQNEYLSNISTAKLGVNQAPQFYASRSDEKIKADLYGIVGFSDILIRIITTLDAELVDTIGGDAELDERIQAVKTHHKIDTTTKDSEIKKIINKIFAEIGLQNPTSHKAALAYLQKKKIIHGTLSQRSRLK